MFKLFKDMKNIDKKFNKQVKINYLTKTYNSNKSQEKTKIEEENTYVQ